MSFLNIPAHESKIQAWQMIGVDQNHRQAQLS